MKNNLQGGPSPKTLRHLVWLALLSASLGARAASVTPGGYTNDFSSPPVAADFATASYVGFSSDILDAAGLDAAVAQLTAASIITPITSAAGAPPNGAGTAIFNSAGNNLQTRPSGVKMCVLMATFTNNSGANATSVRLIYSLIQSTIVAEQVEGVRVYYSLTGAASSWTFVPAWSPTAASLVNASVTLAAPWNVGSPLYLLFADDNGSPSPDTANQIDNFSFAVSGPAPELPVAIASQPQDRTVYESQPATFTVGVNGNAPYTFHWYRGTDPIANATNASYTLVNAQLADSGALFSVVAANVASNISYTATSGVATLTVNALPTNCVVTPAGIVGWWPLDGNVSDVVNDNPTTLAGDPSYVSGKVGTGLSFDGVSNYVRAPASAALDVGTGNGFTVELWINPAQVNTQMPLIEWFNAGQSSLYLWTSVPHPGTGPGGLFANINDTAGGPHYLPAPAGILQAGIFQHVALTYDKITGIGRIFLNGAIVAEQNLGSFTPRSSWDVYFGARPVAPNFFLYQGLMDEIGIYSRALSGAEIQAIAVAGALGKCQPQVTPSIISQPQGLTVSAGTNVVFTVAAAGSSPLVYQWNLSGSPLLDATNATLPFVNVQPAQSGDYTVVVANQFGSVTSQVATLTVFIPRTLALQAQPQSQEGTRVQIPLTLISTGDVAGMTFTINYDTNYLRDLQFNWSPLLLAGFNQQNQNTPGVVSASFVLSENIPGGTQHLATLDFLLRSVPATLDTALAITLQDASDAQGNTVPVNTTVVQGCTQRILVRRIIGDNNANDRLDVGDATVILRFLALLDPVRAWDATGNDVNQNTSLDSGDVTKVLRAAAGIDPQPPVPPGVGKNRASQAAPPAQLLMPAGQFILTPDRTNGTPGQQVTVQVRLQNNASPLSGASFTLNYPTNALRLTNSSAYRLGPIVPGGTLAQWNVAPSQNNFATQNGRLTLAASSANAWPSSNGVLAEVTFTIQPGATGQYLWPLTLTGGETTASGFDNHLFPTANASFIGRVPVAGQLASLVRLAGGQFQFSLAGDTGGTYAVDASTDLIGWTPIQTNALPAGGSLLVQDPAATGQPHRFYRVRSLY